jgi:hypothetical protein
MGAAASAIAVIGASGWAYQMRSFDNHAPLCRHHHRCKQAEGWWLEQPEPGVLAWHTPAGRTYTTTPTRYAA